MTILGIVVFAILFICLLAVIAGKALNKLGINDHFISSPGINDYTHSGSDAAKRTK